MSPQRLDREAWIDAGLEALEQGGTDAVAVVPLARTLGVTRGSFYWHFVSRDELLTAVLERWERVHSDDVLVAAEAIDDPRERLRALFGRAGGKAPSIFVRLLDGAEREPLVRATLKRTQERRLAVIARACRQAGMPPAAARHRALLCYAAYVGLARLTGADGTALNARERTAFARHMVDTLVP